MNRNSERSEGATVDRWQLEGELTIERCECFMIVTYMSRNWLREECSKCGRVVEYYGLQPGTPSQYRGIWSGKKPVVDKKGE